MKWYLADKALLRLQGDEVESFLQGIVTANVTNMQAGCAQLCAMLSPQGKLVHDFFIYKTADAIWLEVAHSHFDALLKKLKLYKMRADVQIADMRGEYGVQFSDRFCEDGLLSVQDARIEGYYRSLVALGDTDESAAYHGWRIEKGIPEAAEDTTDRTFLLDLGYDALGGVDFDKGCYVGQEVTARMHYKSARKRAPYQLRVEEGTVHSGDEVIDEAGKKIGDIRSVGDGCAIAVCQWRAVGLAKEQGLRVGGHAVSVHMPSWFEPTYQAIIHAQADVS